MQYMVVILLIVWCSVAHSEGLDCKLARSAVEKNICSNIRLYKLDEELNSSYANAKSKAHDLKKLLMYQRSWLELRNNCTNEACLEAAYDEQIAFLAAWPEAEGWPEGGAMFSGVLYLHKTRRSEASLVTKFDAMIKIIEEHGEPQGVDQRLISGLKAQENSWLAFRKTECELLGANSMAGGSWPSTYATKCEYLHVKRRLKTINDVTDCILKQTDPAMEKYRCINPLLALEEIDVLREM